MCWRRLLTDWPKSLPEASPSNGCTGQTKLELQATPQPRDIRVRLFRVCVRMPCHGVTNDKLSFLFRHWQRLTRCVPDNVEREHCWFLDTRRSSIGFAF